MITKFKAFICRTGCLSLLSIVFLSACSGPPYDDPLFGYPNGQESKKPFKGIAQHLKILADSNPKQKSAVDIILFHGMGIHNEEWADLIFNRMEELLPEWTKCKCKDELYCKIPSDDEFGPCNETNNRTQGPAIKINTITFTREHDNRKQEIRLHAVIWSGLTTPLKKKLCSDMSEGDDRDRLGCEQDTEYTRERDELNSQLKNGLMNTGLSDVVIYLGETGEEMRKEFLSSIQDILENNKNTNASLVIITSSLASHILTESLSDANKAKGEAAKAAQDAKAVAAQAVAEKAKTKEAQAKAEEAAVAAEDAQAVAAKAATAAEEAAAQLEALVKRLSFMATKKIPLSIFMAANQIPLLELTKMTSTDPVSSDGNQNGRLLPQSLGLVDVLSKLLTPIDEENDEEKIKIQVVAFTDPNDLLSYEIYEIKEIEDVTITNVIISNEGDLFEAHTGYLENERVWELILCGKEKEQTVAPYNSFMICNP